MGLLVLLSGCSGAVVEEPPLEVPAPVAMVVPIAVAGGVYPQGSTCLALVCDGTAPTEFQLPVYAGERLDSLALRVTGRDIFAGEGREVYVELTCDGCESRVGHAPLPFDVTWSDLAIDAAANPVLRAWMGDGNPVLSYSEGVILDIVGDMGVATFTPDLNLTWATREAEVTAGACVYQVDPGCSCCLPHGRLDVGPFSGVESVNITATWDAVTPLHDVLRFRIVCIDGDTVLDECPGGEFERWSASPFTFNLPRAHWPAKWIMVQVHATLTDPPVQTLLPRQPVMLEVQAGFSQAS